MPASILIFRAWIKIELPFPIILHLEIFRSAQPRRQTTALSLQQRSSSCFPMFCSGCTANMFQYLSWPYIIACLYIVPHYLFSGALKNQFRYPIRFVCYEAHIFFLSGRITGTWLGLACFSWTSSILFWWPWPRYLAPQWTAPGTPPQDLGPVQPN